MSDQTNEQSFARSKSRIAIPEEIAQVRVPSCTHRGIREDVVAMPIGQGHEHYGRSAKVQGSNPVKLPVQEVDEDTGALA